MENVPQVIGKKNIADFQKWQCRLESIGYSNYVEVINAKDYGIPQNRKRCFMVSLLGDYSYRFPLPFKRKYNLKDFLDSNVEERFYLSDKMLAYVTANNEKWTGNNDKSTINKSVGCTINTAPGSRRCDASNYIGDGLPEDTDIKRGEDNPITVGNYSKTGKFVQRSVLSPEGPVNTITTGNHGEPSCVDENGDLSGGGAD